MLIYEEKRKNRAQRERKREKMGGKKFRKRERREKKIFANK